MRERNTLMYTTTSFMKTLQTVTYGWSTSLLLKMWQICSQKQCQRPNSDTLHVSWGWVRPMDKLVQRIPIASIQAEKSLRYRHREHADKQMGMAEWSTRQDQVRHCFAREGVLDYASSEAPPFLTHFKLRNGSRF